MNRALVVGLVLLPAVAGADEVFLTGGGRLSGVIVSRSASSVTVDVGPGRVTLPMAETARKHRLTLLLGSLPEQSAEPGKVHNTSVLLGPDGAVLATYRKIHLFDIDLPGLEHLKESREVAPGQEVVVAQAPFGALGLSICYDVRFPELYRALTRRGARVLAVPSAFTEATGKDHWEPLLRARAIENLAYVVAPAQVGVHGKGRSSHGHAMVKG